MQKLRAQQVSSATCWGQQISELSLTIKAKKQRDGHLLANITKTFILLKTFPRSDVKPRMNLLTLSTYGKKSAVRFFAKPLRDPILLTWAVLYYVLSQQVIVGKMLV